MSMSIYIAQARVMKQCSECAEQQLKKSVSRSSLECCCWVPGLGDCPVESQTIGHATEGSTTKGAEPVTWYRWCQLAERRWRQLATSRNWRTKL